MTWNCHITGHSTPNLTKTHRNIVDLLLSHKNVYLAVIFSIVSLWIEGKHILFSQQIKYNSS